MKRVENKTVAITCAAWGIGRASSLLLSQEGATVAVTDINDADGQSVVNEILAAGGVARFWHLDTSDEDNARKVFADVAREFGSIDVLVNNAGIAGVNKPTHEISWEEWDSLMSVNVTGVFLCTKHAIPYMQNVGGGTIINMSPLYELIGADDLLPYHTSNGAVRMMSRNDALVCVKENIRANSVHPNYTWTSLVETLGKESAEDVEAFKNQLDSLHPVGHVGELVDIAYSVLYLASDESKLVTGTELITDGGYTV